jgi:hypothetical protein
MALALPGRQARVPSTPLPSGQLESLRPTASEVLPSDNIPPPFFAQEEGNAMALALPGRQARVPSTPLPSGQLESLGPTASKSEPSDYIPPPRRRRIFIFPHWCLCRRGIRWLWRYRVGRRGCHQPWFQAVVGTHSCRRHWRYSRRIIFPPHR